MGVLRFWWPSINICGVSWGILNSTRCLGNFIILCKPPETWKKLVPFSALHCKVRDSPISKSHFWFWLLQLLFGKNATSGEWTFERENILRAMFRWVPIIRIPVYSPNILAGFASLLEQPGQLIHPSREDSGQAFLLHFVMRSDTSVVPCLGRWWWSFTITRPRPTSQVSFLKGNAERKVRGLGNPLDLLFWCQIPQLFPIYWN